MSIRYHAAGKRWPKRHKFRLPSEWQPEPTMNNDLEDIFESHKIELSKIPLRNVESNHSPNDKKAWETLKQNPEIILKPYDKGRGIALGIPPTRHERSIREDRPERNPTLIQQKCYIT